MSALANAIPAKAKASIPVKDGSAARTLNVEAEAPGVTPSRSSVDFFIPIITAEPLPLVFSWKIFFAFFMCWGLFHSSVRETQEHFHKPKTIMI